MDDTARNFIADKGFDPKFGARPLRRAIQHYVEDPLAEEILRGSFKEKSRIVCKHFENTDHLVFVEDDTISEASETPEESENQKAN